MQQENPRRSNRQRSAATRAALVEAARTLFINTGYARTSTPEIVAAAGVTRGALYHHFTDKQALFRAVVEAESAVVADAIEQASDDHDNVRRALVRGGEAFLDAMALPGRTRLLLLDGPAVLGRDVMDGIDDAHAGRTLREGIAEGIARGDIEPLPADALAALLSAAFDRAALAIEAGGDADALRRCLDALVDGLVTTPG